MNRSYILITPIALGLIFTFLFYQHPTGLNLLLFEMAALAALFSFQKFRLKEKNILFITGGTLISAVMYVVNYTAISMVFNIFSFFILTGVLMYPQAKSLISSFKLACFNLLFSFKKYFNLWITPEGKSNGRGIRTVFYLFRILFFPVSIVLLFLAIYNSSCPYFSDTLTSVSNWIAEYFPNINFPLVQTFALGMICSTFIISRDPNEMLIQKDQNSTIEMSRVRRYSKIRNPFGLKNEINAAMFLLTVLNCMILVVNILDITHVWFNFKWNGTYLKQFVHEGTYLLILSIIISLALVLYYFRGNINYYKGSVRLKQLAVLWVIQNAVLAISVGIRNYWYIDHFALAYKRIGVFFFLLLTLYSMYTIVKKILEKRSAFYLFKQNFAALYFIILIVTLFNWDQIIAKYNFNHYRTAFVHFDFLAELPDKTLPELNKSMQELKEIDAVQGKIFRFDEKYMSTDTYFYTIDTRKKDFKKEWESKGVLSWNYPEYSAYKKLSFLTD